MKLVAFMPHIHGWGHRVRCDEIATQVLAMTEGARVVLLVRSDDPVPPTLWTGHPVQRTTLGRTRAMLSASILVQDGFVFVDLRIRLLKLLGRKLVLVVQPQGFSETPSANRALELADLILIPFPRALLPPSSHLARFGDKVLVVPPVLTVDSVVRTPPDDRKVLYVMVSRPSPGVSEALAAVKDEFEDHSGRVLEIAGSPGTMESRDRHMSLLARAHVILAQGTTAALEALWLGIPLVFLPSAEASEQQGLGMALKRLELARVIPPNEADTSRIAKEIYAALEQTLRAPTRLPGMEESGAKAIARILCNLLASHLSRG